MDIFKNEIKKIKGFVNFVKFVYQTLALFSG